MIRARHLPRRLAVLACVLFGGFSSTTQAQLTELGAHVLTECAAPGNCIEGDFFGAALASGDFNNDGFADLAVGVPDETVGGAENAGAIHVYYGSPAGLSSEGEQFFDQDTPGIGGGGETGDFFGQTLAVGDFDIDGYADLAIGIDNEDLSDAENAGAVIVLFGSSTGLAASGSRFISQNTLPPGSSESTEAGDQFGSALAASATGALAIGVPGESYFLPNESRSGLVHALTTSAPGNPLDAVTDRAQNDFLDECGSFDGNEFQEFWGAPLVFGRFGPTPSLAVGGVHESFSGVSNAGRITVMFGSTLACFDQNTSSIADTAEEGDLFGAALAAGDFDADGFDDLAIGVPGESLNTIGSEFEGGIVQVLFGSSTGLSTRDLLLSQFSYPLNPASGDSLDHFGAVLAAGDFDADGFDDLAVGVPDENVDEVVDAGTTYVSYGSSSGFPESRLQTFHSDFPAGMPDSPNADDQFGGALAAGDFDGNGTDDLAIGMPGETLGSQAQAGAATVLYGLLNATGAFGNAHFSSSITVSEEEGNRIFVAFREGGAVLAASASHSRQGGSASFGIDFSYTPGTMNWSVGDVGFDTAFVHIIADTLDEGDETIVLRLTNPSTGFAIGSPSTVTMTIEDDDEGGIVEFIEPVRVFDEGEQGNTSVLLARTGGVASGVTVQYTTTDITAVAGQDYVAQSGTLTFAAGQLEAVITIELIDDAVAEAGEGFGLVLSNPAGGAALGTQASMIVGIVDNDSDRIFGDGFDPAPADGSRRKTPDRFGAT